MISPSVISRLIDAWLLCLLFASAAFPQGERGAITGTITDPAGAVVPEVEVTAVNVATAVHYRTISTGTGTYRVPALPPGTYSVQATKEGFKEAVVQNVQVAVGATVDVDLMLEIGAASQKITVTAENEAIETGPTTSTTVSPSEFSTWPIMLDTDQRQVTSFIFNSLAGTTNGLQASGTFQGSINGGQTFAYEVLVDGIAVERNYAAGGDTELIPSAESVSEFSLQTGNLGANNVSAGSGVANFVVKSGGNSFHGSAYEYNGNAALNSAGASNNFYGNPKGKYNTNNFGASILGPIRKNKTFFFGTWESTRTASYVSGGLTTFAPLLWRQGDFSDVLGPQNGQDALGRPVYEGEIFDPTTTRTVNGQLVRDPFESNGQLNIIPPSRISSVSKNIIGLMPDPINNDIRNNYFTITCGGACTSDLNEFSIKGDHLISDKHRLSAYIMHSVRLYDQDSGGRGFIRDVTNPLNVRDYEDDGSTLGRISEDWNISPTTLNYIGFGINRFHYPHYSASLNQGWAGRIGLQGVDPKATFPSITFSNQNGVNLQPLGDNFNSDKIPGSWIVKDDFTAIRGKNTFRAGFEFHRYVYAIKGMGGTSGTFGFNIRETQAPGVANTGNQFASFLLGAVDTGSVRIYAGQPTFYNNFPSAYFQDEMKLTPKLTITAGLRWEIPRPRYEAHNYTSGLDLNAPNPGADGFHGALVFLSGTGRHSFQNPYYKEFAPSLGIAYALNRKTVIRMGYSISYDPPIANGYGFSELYGIRGSNSQNRGKAANAFAPVFYWDNGFPAYTGVQLPNRDPAQANGNSVSYTEPNSLAQGYVQTWTFGIQRQLFGSVGIDARYVGNKGTRLPVGEPSSGHCYLACLFNMTPAKYLSLGDALNDDISQHPEIPVPYPSFAGTVNQALRPYPQYQDIGLNGYHVGSSKYNALQVTIRKQPKKGGLGFIMAYTWSKVLTNASDSIGYNYNYQDFNNRKIEWAVADFNHPQDLKLTWIWELPLGKGRPWVNHGGAIDAIAGGWTLTGIQEYRSGNPLQMLDSNYDPSVIFTQVIRPDQVLGKGIYQKSSGYDLANGSAWFNPKAFASVPSSPGGVPLRLGDAPRISSIYGPYRPTETIGMMKAFSIREGMSLRLRVDAQNIFNRTYRSDPVTDLGDPNFGRIIGVNGNRIVQLSGRFQF